MFVEEAAKSARARPLMGIIDGLVEGRKKIKRLVRNVSSEDSGIFRIHQRLILKRTNQSEVYFEYGKSTALYERY